METRTCLECKRTKSIADFINGMFVSTCCLECRTPSLKSKRDSRRNYYKRYPEKKRQESRLRRARKKGADGRITDSEWQDVLIKYDSHCLKCGSVEHITMDHVVPLALGGTHTAANVQPLCMMCNSIKGASVADYR